MTNLPTESQEHNLYLRIQNSTMREAMEDTAQRLGFVYMGAQGFVGAVHRAVERAVLRSVGEVAHALRAAGVAENIIESAVYGGIRGSEAAGLDTPPLTRAIEARVIVARSSVVDGRSSMVVASSHLGAHRFPAAPEVVSAWESKIGQRVSLEWSLVPLEVDAPAMGGEPVSPEAEGASAGEGVGAGVLHPSQRSGL